MKRKLLVLIWIVILAGCGQTRIVDDVNLVQVAAFDAASDKKFTGKFIVATYKQNGDIEIEIFSATGQTSDQVLARASNKSPRPLVIGQLRVVIFGEKLAKKGLKEILDTLDRVPNVGNLVYVSVADKKLDAILKSKYPAEGELVSYLSSLIEQEMDKGLQPHSNLFLFLKAFYDKTSDPYMPFITKTGNDIDLKEVALFRRDKFVGTVTSKEMFIFKILADKYEYGEYEFQVQDKNRSYIGLRNIKSKTKYSLVDNSNHPFIQVNININGKVQEFTKEKNLENPKTVEKIEDAMEKSIKKQAIQLIRKFQKKHIDPLGLGKVYRSHTRDWNEKKWYELYPNVMVKVNVDAEIIQSGVVE
ncbi:Ger(x)C family spore germination protein [Bacillus sp. 165]|uniref:Ger(x)C family spore germination protein n=1 Tax=Bacillus sp. 165 TaxID=1529117 RepID=UPI001ADADDC5|nr:Ger(x)C family spore germination protein [Bacillus sp. 165]MBO9130978.1 Ger(x)C family spore germination protein [Bacillus sp. 165]